MALSIKNDDADRLARELAATTGETLTDAVVIALSERLEREKARRSTNVVHRLRRLADEARRLPVLDQRSADEILGYDPHGLPT
jgi:antitoxin VapB